MFSMRDAVLSHAHADPTSTGDGLRFLGLENKKENIGAGNLYLSALKVIQELEKKIVELKTKKPARRIEMENE